MSIIARGDTGGGEEEGEGEGGMGGYAEQRGCELRGGCGDGAAVFSLGNSRHKFLHYGDSRAHPSYRRPSLFPSSGRGAEHSSAAAGRYRPIAIDDYRRLDPPRVRSFAATSTIALGKHGRALLQPSDRVSLSLSLSLFRSSPPPPSPLPPRHATLSSGGRDR